MKRGTTITFRIAIVLLSLLFAIPILAQDGPPEGPPPEADETRAEAIARVLGLTKEQAKEIQKINRSQRVQLRDAQTALKKARAEADRAIYSDDYDAATVEAKINAVAQAQAEITKIRMVSEASVRRVLTPEQLIKFRRLRDNFAQRNRPANRQNGPLRNGPNRTQPPAGNRPRGNPPPDGQTPPDSRRPPQ
ncbi:MAG: periplasmic heavy metal sensor [Pyrinomonadaceae bacterium]